MIGEKEIKYAALAAGVAAAAYVAYRVVSRRASGSSTGSIVGDIGKEAGGAVVDGASGLIGGIAEGVGGLVGVPETNRTQCDIDMANGEIWDASFSCPAPVFLAWAAKGFPSGDNKGG